jgi:hypothetical protein
MKTDSKVIMEEGGKVTLPGEVCSKYDLSPNTSIRIIETKTGILLVPISNEPINEELASELMQWQELGIENWNMFSYDEEK